MYQELSNDVCCLATNPKQQAPHPIIPSKRVRRWPLHSNSNISYIFMGQNGLNHKKWHAIIGFNHGLPCYVKNMALGPQSRKKTWPTASVFVQLIPPAPLPYLGMDGETKGDTVVWRLCFSHLKYFFFVFVFVFIFLICERDKESSTSWLWSIDTSDSWGRKANPD